MTMGRRTNGKPKPKSVKAKVNSRMNATRKLSRLGKKVKKGKAGPNAEFITRSAAMRKLQITLKDFRRLCILKGIYPRVPTKPLKGADKIYYDIKDISYIANEPLLEKFREFKSFMKKIRRAAGRNQFTEARRVNELKPLMVLDHLVKERYPRFIDALRDLDDCLCMIHLFAALPSVGRVTADRTSACAKLAREWQYFVSKSRSLRKVFVSVKGIYYQAEIMGETINWLVPHSFTQHIPPAVDFRVMVTFMEFYEIYFKFVLYKLYTKQGWQYPPQVDERLDHAGCCLLAMKTAADGTVAAAAAATTATASAAATTTAADAKKKPDSKSALVTAVSTKEFQGKVKSLPDLLKNMSSHNGDDAENNDEDEDEEDELDISAPLSAAFSDLQRTAYNNEEDETDREIFQRGNDAALADQRVHLFSKLTFYINREVPLSIMQLCITAFGGRVSWDGPGAPYKSDDRSITHHIVDRPIQNQASTSSSSAAAAGSQPRDYVQPQWVFDSINAGMLLPTRLYAPGAKLPPHLSPFVDDDKEGYMPRYREEVQKLQIEAGVVDAATVTQSSSSSNNNNNNNSKNKNGSNNGNNNSSVGGKKRAAIDMDEDEEEDSSEEEEEEEAEDSEEEEEDSDEDSDEDSEAEELLEVPVASNNTKNSKKNNTVVVDANNKKGPKAIVQKAKTGKQTEAEENHELAVSMMSKKSKKLYDKMQYGLNQKSESVKRLEEKRRVVEEPETQQKSKKQRKA